MGGTQSERGKGGEIRGGRWEGKKREEGEKREEGRRGEWKKRGRDETDGE